MSSVGTTSPAPAGELFIKIAGQKIEVCVSDGGMFYDKATKLVSSKTLEGLRKKLIKERIPAGGGVPVENWTTGQQGMCIGRPAGRGWRHRCYWRVRWQDGSVTEEYGNSLVPPSTPELRAEKVRLEAILAQKQKEHDAATKAVNLNKPDSIDKTLEQVFPAER